MLVLSCLNQAASQLAWYLPGWAREQCFCPLPAVASTLMCISARPSNRVPQSTSATTLHQAHTNMRGSPFNWSDIIYSVEVSLLARSKCGIGFEVLCSAAVFVRGTVGSSKGFLTAYSVRSVKRKGGRSLAWACGCSVCGSYLLLVCMLKGFVRLLRRRIFSRRFS